MKVTPRDYLPIWLTRTLLVSLILIIVLMPLHAFISTWGGTMIGPLWLWKSWKEIALALLMIPVVVWLSLKPQRWVLLGRDRLFWLIVGFTALLLILSLSYANSNGREAFAAGIAMDTRYLLIFGLAYIVFRFSKLSWSVWRYRATRFIVWTGVVLGILAVIQVTLIPATFLEQFGYDKYSTIAPYVLIDENPDALRAFVTMRGPNDLGAYLLIPLALSLLLAKINKRWLLAAMPIVGGIVATGSRSAWIGAIVVAAVTGLAQKMTSPFSQKKVVVGAGIAMIVGVGALVAALNVPALRLAIFHSSPGDSSLTEGSTDKHWEATASGISRVIAQPLGCGAGCAGPASYYSDNPKISENYYVQLAEEGGVVGLLIWATIAGIVGLRLWRMEGDVLARGLLTSFVALSVIGLWLHVWSDDPLSLTWWVLSGALLGHYASALPKKPVS